LRVILGCIILLPGGRRLNELRAEYRTMMEAKWNGRQFVSMYLGPREFHRIAIEEQKYYAKQLISSELYLNFYCWPKKPVEDFKEKDTEM